MNKLILSLMVWGLAAAAPAQEPPASSVEELARALGGKGLLDERQQARILELAAKERQAAPSPALS
ncbi:MAG: hypothetical protein PHF00_12470, partial [Elusimicrobia bacterium]|nr:hypothetical protein [Elusimicrobiota bacterium]